MEKFNIYKICQGLIKIFNFIFKFSLWYFSMHSAGCSEGLFNYLAGSISSIITLIDFVGALQLKASTG